MTRRTKILTALTIVILMVGGAYYYFIQVALPHFYTTRKGVLYRSGQPRGLGLAWVKHYGIRTLINLRKPDSNGTSEEKAFAAENGLNFYNFSIGSSHENIEETRALPCYCRRQVPLAHSFALLEGQGALGRAVRHFSY